MPSSRAARFVKQPGGHTAFVPAPLPPDPPIEIAGHLPELLARASLALGRLHGVTGILPNPDVFFGMYVEEGGAQLAD
jgi:hypothetical protein